MWYPEVISTESQWHKSIWFLGNRAAEIANISERRLERLINHQLNDLPAFLAKHGGLNSGFMITQHAAAALGIRK